jgi:TonB family protein
VRALLLIAICGFAVAVSAQESFMPAQLQTGAAPALPVLAVGGGQVLLELTVDSDGRVSEVKPLRTTPPFTEMVTQAVREWRFRPAEDARRPVASKVLVAGVFRPPALNMPTLGESPKEGAPASVETAFPLTTSVPAFPPQANRGGVVLIEARVDRGGRLADMNVLHSTPPFDDAARSALADWVFRPARVGGADAPTLVYVVLGFATPVSNGVPAPAYGAVPAPVTTGVPATVHSEVPVVAR